MRRWVLLLVFIFGVGGLLLLRLGQPATQLRKDNSVVHDPDALPAIREAMKAVGYSGKAFTGYEWRAPGCDTHTYLVHPSVPDAAPFLFVRSLTTGEMRFLRGDELDQILKKHVTYEGRFLGIPRGLGDGNDYYSLGYVERSGERVFIDVGFDEKACGLVVDEVWYWSPRVDEKVKLNLRLLP